MAGMREARRWAIGMLREVVVEDQPLGRMGEALSNSLQEFHAHFAAGDVFGDASVFVDDEADQNHANPVALREARGDDVAGVLRGAIGVVAHDDDGAYSAADAAVAVHDDQSSLRHYDDPHHKNLPC